MRYRVKFGGWLLVLPVGPLLFSVLRYVSTYTMGF